MADENKAPGFAGLSKKETDQVQGEAAPNQTPTFAKHDGQDENNRVGDPAILAAAKQGADAQSGGAVDAVDMQGLVAAQAVGDTVAEGNEEKVQYTSRIASLRIGRFQFVGGVLSLDSGDVSRFEDLVGQTSPRTQNAIRKIERGEGVIAKPLNLGSRSTRGVDTTRRDGQSPAPSTSR